MMTLQQAAQYKENCRRINELYRYDYINEELEALMLSPQWKAIYDQLAKQERREVRGYLNYIQDTSFGYLDTQIQAIEALTARAKQLQQLELNARWLVCDRNTGLYWARVIHKPYWDKKHRAFLFSQEQAEFWVKKFAKITTWYRFAAVKVDATRRLARSKF
ncbi:hypothetical protein [Fischerella sp. PCC 9605]|uniref:hypothetical protein n=1 Tax=Fischerella sp. PCC 9605 TaxID=1173024 RepID=UPI000479EEA3|nr:hypothetical protein [Fischerella sp. PCC 9605]